MNSEQEHYDNLFAKNKKLSEQEKRKISKVIVRIVQKTNKKKFTYVLDVGSAMGDYTNELSKYSEKAIGIDFSKEGIKKAKANYPNCEFVFMDAFEPIFDKKFDLIFCQGFSGANTHDLEFVANWTNKYIELLDEGGFFVFSYSTNLSGKEVDNETANWTKKELKTFISLVNAKLFVFYFWYYFGFLSKIHKTIKNILKKNKVKKFYYIIFEKK